MEQKERANVLSAIRLTSVAKLHPRLDEGQLLKELVAQFLVHEGYVETAKVFVEEVDNEQVALGRPTVPNITRVSAEDDLDAINRQRMLILRPSINLID